MPLTLKPVTDDEYNARGPHVIAKLWSGESEQQKQRLADQMIANRLRFSLIRDQREPCYRNSTA